MNCRYLSLLLLALCLAPMATKASPANALNSLSIAVAADHDETVPQTPIVDQNRIVAVKIVNHGFRTAILDKMIAEYAGYHTETHELENMELM